MGSHNICLYKEVDKKYTGCNLKTIKLLDCVLIGASAVIWSNTVSNVIIFTLHIRTDDQTVINTTDNTSCLTHFEKMICQRFLHAHVSGHKFELAVKRSNDNLGSSFEQIWQTLSPRCYIYKIQP